MLIYINYKLLINMLNYLLLSICHNVGKIGTMQYQLSDEAREGGIILNILRRYHIKHTPS